MGSKSGIRNVIVSIIIPVKKFAMKLIIVNIKFTNISNTYRILLVAYNSPKASLKFPTLK